MRHLKLTISLFGALFILGLLGLNMYSSTSLPGFGGDAGCYTCHNDPVYVSDIGTNNLPQWNATTGWPNTNGFNAVQEFSTNYVPLVYVPDPVLPAFDEPNPNLEFVKLQFAMNDSHISILVRLAFDDTIDTTDKFAIVFNIDSTNFSIGQFMDNGLMKLDNGHADIWIWDGNVVAPNGTGMATDQNIDTTYHQADTNASDVHVAVSHGVVGFGGTMGYYVQFTRARITQDTLQDVQFGDGAFIAYGIAWWNATTGMSHHSSFDKALVVGPTIEQTVQNNPYMTVTQQHTVTETETETIIDEDTITLTTGSASAFTAVMAIATIIAIPVIFRLKRK